MAIVDEVYRRLAAISAILPDGITIDEDVGFIDFSAAIREAVEETEFTLVFGAVLAVFTVFVFLRRTRPTLIVATAIPISLIASFGLVWLFDYTLNTMTLLGMTLAVGVVIDDAIVVLENIERHREAGEDAAQAARRRHARDRLRGHRRDVLGGRGVPAGRVRARASSGASSARSA